MKSTVKAPFQLSEPGSSLSHDPAMREYLRCYKLPFPPDIRYGFVRFESKQSKYRVGLFGQAWLPAHPVGCILLTHGFAEHSGNYAQLIHNFVAENFAVAALDLRGHGLSEGARGHTDTPTAYAEDIEQFAQLVLPSLTTNRPLYLWGHSLGSLITLQLLLRKKLPVAPTAVALTSAFVGFPVLKGMQKILASLSPLMSKIFPTLPANPGHMPNDLSHDKEYLNARARDPLISNIVTPRWFMSCKQVIEEVQSRSEEFQALAPTLFLLAGDERITNANEARRFAFHAYAQLKHRVIEFPGCRHELEKEPEIRDRVVSETLAWFKSHK